jgi:hypothetical protein
MTNKPQRLYTFQALKRERGWPYSRQHTVRLIKAGRFPRPKKAPGGALNIWTSEQIDNYFASLAFTDASDNQINPPVVV